MAAGGGGSLYTISIHAPLAGSDFSFRPGMSCVTSFQSTLPLRGATSRGLAKRAGGRYFNPRSPCGERHGTDNRGHHQGDISIHAPLAGSDPDQGRHERLRHISIHAPLAGSDAAPPERRTSGRYFNPRSPCGERLPAVRYASAA